jgi:hypothetical protein
MTISYSGEWYGHDRWRNAVRAVRTAQELTEGALKDATAKISPDVLTYEDEATYYLVDEPASILRGGMLTSLYGSFEFSLLALCEQAGPIVGQLTYDQKPERIGGASKCRIEFLGAIVGTDFYSSAAEFRPLQLIRNAVTHSEGLVPYSDEKSKDLEAVSKWIYAHSKLASLSGSALRLEGGFIPHVADYFDGLLQAMFSNLSSHPLAIATAKASHAFFSRFVEDSEPPDEYP